MIDLKILLIKDLLPILEVSYATGVSPLSLIIIGDKFNQASTVQINDMVSPEFVVVSPSKILAQIPDSQKNVAINKIAVIANLPSVNRRSILNFEVGQSIKEIHGLERLVQSFCKILLQSPGSDKFKPEEGAGLLKLVGRNVAKNDTKSLQASVVGAVSRARDQILSIQSTNRKIPPDERLLNVITEAVGFDVSTTTLSARINLSAISGRQAVANINL